MNSVRKCACGAEMQLAKPVRVMARSISETLAHGARNVTTKYWKRPKQYRCINNMERMQKEIDQLKAKDKCNEI
jgi:hypothetical protein